MGGALGFWDEPGLTFAAGGIDHVGEVDFCSLYVDGALRHTWQREGVVWAVAFSPGGATLAAGSSLLVVVAVGAAAVVQKRDDVKRRWERASGGNLARRAGYVE